MKPLSQMTHYELLEVPPDCSMEDIERAYRMANLTWGDDALASYSLYEAGEADAIRERVELAYRVLSDEQTKRDYDAGLVNDEFGLEQDDELALDLSFAEGAAASSSVDLVAAEIETFDDVTDEDGAWNGARLRRARLRRGIDVEKIADVTKINPTYLRFIEDDQYEDLPARVYVRGFVVSYARCLGLDAERVASSYLQFLSEATPEPTSKNSARGS